MIKEVQATSVQVKVVVEAPIDQAFTVFTEGIGTWFPPEYNLLAVPIAERVFEPRVGGRVYDRGTDGSECQWARVLAYEPPNRLVISWDISPRWQIETNPAKTPSGSRLVPEQMNGLVVDNPDDECAMKTATRPDHHVLAEALRRRVLERPGEIDPVLRQAVAASATGGPPAQPPYDALARQIGEAAHRTTDGQVANVVSATGSEKAGFEVILAAAVGASLLRWQQAIKALDEATHAPS